MLKSREASKPQREERVRQTGYPAYVTSAGWLGYDDEKVRRLTLEALQAGFNHFKVRKYHFPVKCYINIANLDESRRESRFRSEKG